MPEENKPITPKTSALLEDIEKDIIETPQYDEDEQNYLNKLQIRLQNAKNQREQPFEEFDGMTYTQYWQKNEDLANTKIPPKKNKTDVQFQSGTLRTKLFAFLASLIGLNLSPDVSAYDQNNLKVSAMGEAIEDTIEKTEELEGDEEKKQLRWYELLKQGDVFVEEIWDDRWTVEKDIVKGYHGQFRGVKIKNKVKRQDGKPVRNIVSGLSVFLGDLTKYLIKDQPYIFTVEIIRYSEAEKIYGGFEMWKHVKKNINSFSGTDETALMNAKFNLSEQIDEGYVEIIKYQDKPNHEYQIIVNSIPMLPLGFPFPWGYSEYNITQQHYRPIRHNFAYGKSFTFENKNAVALLDEMMKLALLKTYKSYLPPYLNTTGRVITSKVLTPGYISMGLGDNPLKPIEPNALQGVTQSELAMIQEITRNIDQNTASATFTGQKEKGKVLATEIIEIQRQSRIMLGITILSASLLEKKLSELRLMNILKNWFNPIDTELNEARTELKNRYRITTVEKTIGGEGQGFEMIIPMEKLMAPEQLRERELQMKKATGKPVRIIALNPKELEQAKLTWVITVNAKEKRSSELSKLLFRAKIGDAVALGLIPNPQWLQERFAEVWEEDPAKMFSPPSQMPMPAVAPGITPVPGGQTPPVKVQATVGKGSEVKPNIL